MQNIPFGKEKVNSMCIVCIHMNLDYTCVECMHTNLVGLEAAYILSSLGNKNIGETTQTAADFGRLVLAFAVHIYI